MGSRRLALHFDPKELNEQYNLYKESIWFNWSLVVCQLARLKRSFPSPKLFGQEIARTPFTEIKNYDRPSAIWLFQNWRLVLDWVESANQSQSCDPFDSLAKMNVSHPAEIKRIVLAWKAKIQRVDV